MTTFETKTQIFFTLNTLFEQELQWIISKQYTSQHHYQHFMQLIQKLPELSQDDLTDISRKIMASFQDVAIVIGERIKQMIDLSLNEVHNIRDKFAEQEQESRQLRDKIQSLEDARDTLIERVDSWEREYDILKAQAIEMQSKLEDEIKRTKSQKKQIRRTFIKVQEQTEEERKMLENLQFQKDEFHHLIQDERKEKAQLLEQLQILKRKVQQSEKRARTSQRKASYEYKKIQMLQVQITEKNKIIQDFYDSQRSISNFPKHKEVQMITIDKKEEFLSPTPIKRISELEVFKLGDELASDQFQIDFKRVRSHRNSITSERSFDINKINGSIIEEVLEESKAEEVVLNQQEQKVQQSQQKQLQKRIPLIPDIYFAHYLLTVQSMKLKINREQLYNVQMSSSYKDLVNSTIPFHRWDQWIKEKLQKMIKSKS